MDTDTVTVTDPPAPTDENEPAPVVEVEGNAPGETWSPPKVEDGTGIAVDGDGLPVNHRLRAERLADDGKDEDPGGVIAPELIADAADRLAAERKARPPVAANMKVADLERIAKRENIDISGAANNADRVALIEAARGVTGEPNGENV
jgi:hypothetical protein